ncbi:CLUMA_CG018260, isoform A [Clunio marinus]|uniref:Mitochondrial fission process protein 1 n=1 Tax=Clunio marinus TaxID=568069 RepID=A0A1J1J3U3_9DIPT|nr:CLUMA_CG018260, isoform A [Clunio marinus]
MTDNSKTLKKEYDIYRDSLLRYLGYSNELGESFRPLIKKSYVHASYAVAIAYVFADTADKSLKSYEKDKNLIKSVKIGSDVVIWQMLASVMIPGFTINRICWTVGKGLKYSKFKHPLGKWIPTIVGLLSIPLIIRPIDRGVDFLMDETFRKYVH